MSLDVKLVGLEGADKYFKALPDLARSAAKLAINFGAKRARQTGSKEMRRQVAFAPSYLSRADRFRVSKQATEDNLTAEVTGRGRATSLRQFAQGVPQFGVKKDQKRRKVFVKVSPGVKTEVVGGIWIRLKNGNEGIASRGRPGARKSGENPKYELTRRGGKKTGLYLRYGPSVDQVFNTVRETIAPGVSRATESEFYRQFRRLSK